MDVRMEKREVVGSHEFTHPTDALIFMRDAQQEGFVCEAMYDGVRKVYIVQAKRREAVPLPITQVIVRDMPAIHEYPINKPDCWI